MKLNELLKKEYTKLRFENVLIFLGALAVILLLFFHFHPRTVTWTFDEEYIQLKGPFGSGAPVILYYDDIRSAEILDDFPVGEQVDGYAGKDVFFGTWENEEFGRYTLCIGLKCTDYIQITTEEGIVVCNAADEEETAAFCETIRGKGIS